MDLARFKEAQRAGWVNFGALEHVTTPAADHLATYACGDLAVKVRFDNTADTAVLAIGDRVLTLPLAVSGSGARYADTQGNELWTKGMEDGTLTLAGEPPRTCVAAR